MEFKNFECGDIFTYNYKDDMVSLFLICYVIHTDSTGITINDVLCIGESSFLDRGLYIEYYNKRFILIDYIGRSEICSEDDVLDIIRDKRPQHFI